MAWDLDTAKELLGIDPGDTTQDANVQRAMDVTLNAVETRLGRQLLRARETVRFISPPGCCDIQVTRFPIIEVYTVNDAPLPDACEIHHTVGAIYCPAIAQDREVIIDYEGGYDPLPPELENVMWSAFVDHWSGLDPATGGPPVEEVAGEQSVKSVTVFDGFKVDYATSSTSSSSQGSYTGTTYVDWGWLEPWSDTLSYYRHGQYGTGLGFA